MYRRLIVATVQPSRRTYVGLAFNQTHKNDAIDRSLKSFQHTVNGPTNTISEVGKGIIFVYYTTNMKLII